MADLPETPGWEAHIRQLEHDDMAEGGRNGLANIQAVQLANRTSFLKYSLDGIKAGEIPYADEKSAKKAIDDGFIPLGAIFTIRSANPRQWVLEYQNINGKVTPVLNGDGVQRSLPAAVFVEEVQSNIDVTNDFITGVNLSRYTGNEIHPIALDDNNRVLLGYDQDSDSIVGAGLVDADAVDSISQFNTETNLADLSISRFYGSAIHPIALDENNRVLLGYDAENDVIFGAGLNQGQSDNVCNSVLIPLADHLKPIPKPMNIMLGYGQSLSIGATAVTIISDTQPYQKLTFLSGPRGYWKDYSGIGPLKEDHRQAPDGSSNRGETFCSGAANYASTLMAVQNGIDPAMHVIFASTAGKGGTKIADLVKGSEWYAANFLPHVVGAHALNSDSAVHTVLWAQGETDIDQSTPTSFDDYRNNLEQLQIDAEVDIKSVNGQASPVFFITYQCSYRIRRSANIALAQLDLVQKNEKFHFSTPCYHLPFASDATHLTNVGYKWLGAYYARAYKMLVIDKSKPQYLRPISATLRGKVITVAFEPPVPPVVLDVTNLAQTENFGFRIVLNASGVTLAIKSILTHGRNVLITLQEKPVSSVTVHYGLDYLGVGLNIMEGASGNLRDSDRSTINIEGVDRPLFSVCPHFKLNVIMVGE